MRGRKQYWHILFRWLYIVRYLSKCNNFKWRINWYSRLVSNKVVNMWKNRHWCCWWSCPQLLEIASILLLNCVFVFAYCHSNLIHVKMWGFEVVIIISVASVILFACDWSIHTILMFLTSIKEVRIASQRGFLAVDVFCNLKCTASYIMHIFICNM